MESLFFQYSRKYKEHRTKVQEFKIWFKDNVAKDITDNELNNIPQVFIDSYEARNINDKSNTELSHLIAWISQLEPLALRLGEIQAPDAQIKEKIEEKERKTVSENQTLNIKTTISAEYKRYKCTPYIGDIFYTEWEEIENTRQENKEVLPVEPVGPETVEEDISVLISPTYDISVNYYTYKNTPWGHRHHVDQRKSYQIKKTIVKERTVQPLNDGSIKYRPWKEVKSKCKEEEINVKNYERRD